jgi:hypothetical protein
MKRLLLGLLLFTALFAAAPRKPKLVLAIVIDQFRYDYLTRFRSDFHGGLDRLLTRGAVLTNARYIHSQTLTAPGHSTLLSGATPSVSGIVGNEWFDREENRKVTSVQDFKTKLLGGGAVEGASPRRLLVSTLGDELKLATGRKSRVIGISLKDRAAILPAGHMADGAYWFDLKTGNFVSSDFYMKELPQWVKDFNGGRPGDKYRGTTWMGHKLPEDLTAMYGNSTTSPFEASGFGNEILCNFIERALANEPLGKDEYTDVLAISFSSNDKVGHDYGTFSAEEREVTLQTDKLLERLFQTLEKQVGMENVLVVLTGDHGVSISAEEAAANRMPGGRLAKDALKVAVEAGLTKRFGAGEWVAGFWDTAIYLNLDTVAQKRLDAPQVRRAAAEAAFAVPHVLRAFTRDQLASGSIPVDETGQRVINGFNWRRSPDVSVIMEPYWMITESKAATHGSPFSYDAHVPIVMMGPWFRAGRYAGAATVNDIAPTLASLLEVETPSGSVGRVLTEILTPP